MSDSVDDYNTSALPEVQDVLQQIRDTLHETLPGAGEQLGYRTPALTVHDRAVIHLGVAMK